MPLSFEDNLDFFLAALLIALFPELNSSCFDVDLIASDAPEGVGCFTSSGLISLMEEIYHKIG